VLTEVLHPVGRVLPEHDHALDYLCMLVHGSYAEAIAGQEIEYTPFRVGFHPAGIAHRDRVGAAGGRFLCLELRAQALHASDMRLRVRPGLLPADATTLLVRLYRASRAGTLEPIGVDSIAWELCGGCAGERALPERARPRWLARCLALVEDACGEPWTVDAAARAVGVHPVHLAREFRRRFGQTFGEYLQKARVRAACARIVGCDEPLAATAAHTGFADQSHFCKVFKARVGCTPSAFAALAAARRRRSASPQPPLPRYSM
jgi:AraC family transcriptional regulator